MINRRNFLMTTAVGASAAVAAKLTSCAPAEQKTSAACTKSSAPALNISFQESVIHGESLPEKLDIIEGLGGVGLEPWGAKLWERVSDYEKALQGRNIKISAICAGFDGFILSTDQKIYSNFMDTYKRIIEAAGQLGSVGVIMVPAFNNQVPCRPHTQDTRDFLVEQLKELGDFASHHNTSVILEPLIHKESFYLRQVGDAARICRDVASPGVKCMGDFWHMTWEESNDYGAFWSAREHLAHVHIASRANRNFPSEDGAADNYVEGFRALKELNYQGYVSFECWTNADKTKVVPQAVELIRRQWDEA